MSYRITGVGSVVATLSIRCVAKVVIASLWKREHVGSTPTAPTNSLATYSHGENV